MFLEVIFAGTGVIATHILGWCAECFLTKSVTVTQKVKPHLLAGQTGGGGKQLGTLERLLFFASFWLDKYAAVAAAWLAFKVAAKWAAWQHIAKLKEGDSEPEDRIFLSSHLLGRFQNGTLYNVFCAAMGVGFAKLMRYCFNDWLSEASLKWLVGPLVIAVITIVIAFIGSELFCDWPTFKKERKISRRT